MVRVRDPMTPRVMVVAVAVLTVVACESNELDARLRRYLRIEQVRREYSLALHFSRDRRLQDIHVKTWLTGP